MDELDSDQALLTSYNGKVAKRDIVQVSCNYFDWSYNYFQFVPFRNFIPPSGIFTQPEEAQQAKRRLAQEVLEEVPDQVTSYMRTHGIKPLPPKFTLPEDGDLSDLTSAMDSALLGSPQNTVNGIQLPYNPAY